MKHVLLFHFEACPYCQRAREYLKELQKEQPEFAQVSVEFIDEKLNPDIAERYDYYYVPTFYVDGVKVHEGACDKAQVESVLRAAIAP